MQKKEIIDYLNKVPMSKITPNILTLISNSLNDDEYKMQASNGVIIIKTIIKDIEEGLYLKIVCKYNNETKTKSLIVIEKQYNKIYKRKQSDLNLFTRANSYIYTQDNILLYKSSFSDEKTYSIENKKTSVYTKEILVNYFKETTPTYENGYFISAPISINNPFLEFWERYINTNVVRISGRNPIDGKYSDIAITFNSHLSEDIKLLSERNGLIYSNKCEMKLTNKNEIIHTIEKIYQDSKTTMGFDLNKFNLKFEEIMFEPLKRKY